MDTTRCKVIFIMLQHILIGHMVYVLFLAVAYLVCQYITHTISVNYIEANLVRILECLQDENILYQFLYYSCLYAILCFWIYISFMVSTFTLDRLFCHNVTCSSKALTWQSSLYFLIKLYQNDFELHCFYVACNFLVFWILFCNKKWYIERSTRHKKNICILIFTLIRMYYNGWDVHWILFSTCFAIADELKYVIITTFFFFDTFLPGLYTTDLEHIKSILNQDLQWAIRIHGDTEIDFTERDGRLRISNVYTKVFVKRKSPLHGSYEYSKGRISAHLLLVHPPYHDPNYCDSYGRFPLWYNIKKCCNFSGKIRLPNGQQWWMRHSLVALTYKKILLEFMINVQAGLKITSCPFLAKHCLHHAIDQTNKTKVYLFLREAGILGHFDKLTKTHSSKWDRFNYPLSLKRMCGNVIRVSVKRNAFFGVNLLSKDHYLPQGSKLEKFITLCDIFESFGEISVYIWSDLP